MFFHFEAGVSGQVPWLCAWFVEQTLLSETMAVDLLCLRAQEGQICLSMGPEF